MSAASIAPSQFIGKSFDECGKILGKPKLIEKKGGDYYSYIYYYKVPVPGLTRIILYGALGRKQIVEEMSYDFPKGQVKTWQSACAKVGISVKGASVWP